MFPFKPPQPKTECKIPSCTFPSPLPLPVSSYAPPLLAIVFPLPLFWSALPPPASFSPPLPAGAAVPAAAGAGRGCEPGGHASASAASPQRPSGAAGSSSRSMLGSSFGLLQHWIAPSDTSSWKQNHTLNASLSHTCSAFLMPLHTDHIHRKALFEKHRSGVTRFLFLSCHSLPVNHIHLSVLPPNLPIVSMGTYFCEDSQTMRERYLAMEREGPLAQSLLALHINTFTVQWE